MKCPSCAAADLVRDTRDMSYTYKGETTSIPDVTGDYCPACGEAVLLSLIHISSNRPSRLPARRRCQRSGCRFIRNTPSMATFSIC